MKKKKNFQLKKSCFSFSFLIFFFKKKNRNKNSPILPGRWMWPGIIPILHSPGLMMPGQLGPIKRVLHSGWMSLRLTLTMSNWGIPSVIQTAKGISASIASWIAFAAKGGGT